jgi:hypothetical protein
MGQELPMFAVKLCNYLAIKSATTLNLANKVCNWPRTPVLQRRLQNR